MYTHNDFFLTLTLFSYFHIHAITKTSVWESVLPKSIFMSPVCILLFFLYVFLSHACSLYVYLCPILTNWGQFFKCFPTAPIIYSFFFMYVSVMMLTSALIIVKAFKFVITLEFHIDSRLCLDVHDVALSDTDYYKIME